MFEGLNSRCIDPPLMKCTEVPQFTALQIAASRFKSDPKLHLKYLLADTFRCQGLMAVHNTSPAFEEGDNPSSSDSPSRNKEAASPFIVRREGSGTFGNNGGPGDATIGRWKNSGNQRRIILDYSRQHVNGETMELLFDLADMMGLTDRMNEMRSGMDINFTERRPVLHHVLRMPRGYDFKALHPQGDTILDGVHSVLDRIATFSEDVRNGRLRGCTGKKLRNIMCIGTGGAHSGPEAVY